MAQAMTAWTGWIAVVTVLGACGDTRRGGVVGGVDTGSEVESESESEVEFESESETETALPPESPLTLALGGSHTCALRADGALGCWGENQRGQLGIGTVAPDGAPPTLAPTFAAPPLVGSSATSWTSLAAGHSHTCALRSDHTLWCWGWNGDGQLGRGTFSIAEPTPVAVAAPATWSAVAAGPMNTCAIRADDASLWCWGTNFVGQLGDGTTERRPSPVPIAPGKAWRTVALGDVHACAIDTDGAAWCWGRGDLGALGTGDAGDSLVPRAVTGGHFWKRIAVGGDTLGGRTCAIEDTGALWCWGASTPGPLAIDNIQTSTPRLADSGLWSSVTLQRTDGCAVRVDGSLSCWGDDRLAQLGTGARGWEQTPMQLVTPPEAGARWQSVVLAADRTCADTAAGRTYCWGSNVWVPFGDGRDATPRAPTRTLLAAASEGVHLEAGGDGTCAETSTRVACWGGNHQGGLGLFGAEAYEAIDAPADVPAPTSPWRELSMGTEHSCGIDQDDALWCWGGNIDGAVGSGTDGAGGRAPGAPGDPRAAFASELVETPRRVGCAAGLPCAWRHVSAGGLHTCAIAADRTLWCWGDNYYGQVAGPDLAPVRSPIVVGSDPSWDAVAAGSTFTCALQAPGTLWCWGWLFFASAGTSNAPARVGDRSDWTTLVAGGNHLCLTRADGALACLGADAYGQAGAQGVDHDAPVAILVGGASDPTAAAPWRAVAAGDSHTCAIDAAGGLWCWGKDWEGQLGDGRREGWSDVPLRVEPARTWQSVATGKAHTCAATEPLEGTSEVFCWGSNVRGQLGIDTAWNVVPTELRLDP